MSLDDHQDKLSHLFAEKAKDDEKALREREEQNRRSDALRKLDSIGAKHFSEQVHEFLATENQVNQDRKTQEIDETRENRLQEFKKIEEEKLRSPSPEYTPAGSPNKSKPLTPQQLAIAADAAESRVEEQDIKLAEAIELDTSTHFNDEIEQMIEEAELAKEITKELDREDQAFDRSQKNQAERGSDSDIRGP